MIQNSAAAARGLVQALGMVAVAAGVGVWGAILLAPRPGVPPPALAAGAPMAADTGPVSAWFGAGPAVRVQVASSGLIAAGARSSAILSVDGGRARTYAVGAVLANDLVLEAVRGDGVVIRQGGQTSVIEVPRLAPPSGISPVGAAR